MLIIINVMYSLEYRFSAFSEANVELIRFTKHAPITTFHSAIEQQQQDENSSLLYHSAVEPTVRFQEEEPPRRKRSAKELWGILREHVMNESFHLEDWRTKTERVRTRDQEKHFSEMTLPYEFGVIHCVAAWVVYLGISIVAYSYVFEQWTAIEVSLND